MRHIDWGTIERDALRDLLMEASIIIEFHATNHPLSEKIDRALLDKD